MSDWTPPSWTVADRIRKAREQAGLEQTQLADATGLSRVSISNYERGFRTPQPLAFKALAEALKVPEEWLRNG
jgi:transcriptional regulator with XRE-family HTH domain